MNKTLKNYIKLLLESSGWSELNNLIKELNNIGLNSDEKEIKKYLIQNGYKRLGSGNFREVFSKDDEDWVIKVASSYYASIQECRESNLIEVRTTEERNDLIENLPRLYGYDKEGKWLITEKCKTFNLNLSQEQEDVLFQILPTLKTLQNVFKYYGLPEDITDTQNIFEIIRLMIWEFPKNKNVTNISAEEYEYIAGNLKNFDFINELFYILFENFNYYMNGFYRDEIIQMKNDIYNEIGGASTPDDIAYLYRLNQKSLLSDIHLDNLGYSVTPKNGNYYTTKDLLLIDTGFEE